MGVDGNQVGTVDETPVRELVTFIVGLEVSEVPEAPRADAKRLLLDALASALVGSTSAETARVAAALTGSLGPGRATVIGRGPASPAAAAAINGYSITARSLCDVHRPTLCHVTPVVVPAALAAAERIGASGADLLAGLMAGLEVTVRLGYALRYEEFRRRGWHTPGVAGPFGAAAAAARLGRLDRAATGSALGIAGSQSGGTFASFGTPTIKFHQARAALAGLLAADLAAQGFRGNPAILTAEDGGLLRTFSDGGDPAALIDGLGTRWRLQEIETRRWPAAAALQPLIAALLDLRHVGVDAVASVEVGLPPASFEMNAAMTWEDTFHATLSARWVAAVSLFDGDCWLGQLSPERLGDEQVSQFAANRVAVHRDPSLPEGAATVALRLRDGRLLSGGGLAAGPVAGDAMRATEEKLLHASTGVIPEASARRVAELVADLEQVPDVRELTGLLAGEAGAASG